MSRKTFMALVCVVFLIILSNSALNELLVPMKVHLHYCTITND